MEENVETGKISEDCSKIYSLAIDHKNKHLFYGTNQHSIKVYNLEKNYIVKELLGHSDNVWELKISRDYSYLISGGSDGVAFVWDLRNNFKQIQMIFFEKNILSLELDCLNRNLFMGGSRKKPIVKINMESVLTSSPEEFTKAMVIKRKNTKLRKEWPRKEAPCKLIDEEMNRQSLKKEKDSPKCEYLIKAVKSYESCISTLEKEDQEKVRALVLYLE